MKEQLGEKRGRIYQKAKSYLTLLLAEGLIGDYESRLREIKTELADSGTYTQTLTELTWGAKIAWRNSNRCIGRLFWETLEVFDHRDLSNPDEIFSALNSYVQFATNGGKIKPAISVFKPLQPEKSEEIRIWNSKLIRYAGYQNNGYCTGDPEELALTRKLEELGWKGAGTEYDVLPVAIQSKGWPVKYYTFDDKDVLEVYIKHPTYSWFEDLQLRWYAVPMVSDMVMEVGGLLYTAAPFNGWFMATEIASRNLGDAQRYNKLPLIAQKMGLSLRSNRNLWKDRAMLELNVAVIESFQQAGVTIVDHHTASDQFIKFMEKEKQKGRIVQADWSWIVPPMSGSATSVFHRDYPNELCTPNFHYKSSVMP